METTEQGAVRVESAALTGGFAMVGAIVLLVFPMYDFVRPVLKGRSVGDRRAHAYILAMLTCVMSVLYAALSLPSSLPFLAINGVGILLHLFYIILYLWFATDKKKRAHALILLFAAVAVSAPLVTTSMVFRTRAWSTTLVAVMASAFGASMHILRVFDVVRVMKSKQVKNMMNPIRALLILFNGSTWIAYAFLSVPVNLYILVPNLIGTVSAVVEIAAHCLGWYRRSNSIHAADAVDYGHEMRDLFTSPV